MVFWVMDYRDFDTELRRLRKEILVRLIGAFGSENFADEVEKMAKDVAVNFANGLGEPEKVRAEIHERTVAALGFSAEERGGEDIQKLADEALIRSENEEYPLTVLSAACNRCPAAHYESTALCRNCTAKYCMAACRFGAISMANGRSSIDAAKCKKCDQCRRSCPYGAIAKTVVPCQAQCPVDAIGKGESGKITIDFDRCISCGRCSVGCPFGAIAVKSQIVSVLRSMANGETIALYAPSWIGQHGSSGAKLRSALRKVGFSDSCEVALGAEFTAIEEAEDFRKHLDDGKPFMTTSCCAAYNEFREKHLKEINPYVSKAETPLFHTAKLLRRRRPKAILVFISPCFAKYREVRQNPNVDYVLNYEEIDALFTARSVDLSGCDEKTSERPCAKEAREFGLSGGVARSVQAAWKGDGSAVKPVVIDGLTKETINQLRSYVRENRCADGNLVEVMACAGGCAGGPATICSLKKSQPRIAEDAATGPSIAAVQLPAE
ncbi:MAG: 4Fe-4S binding protein [Puniceicoccales bacterium]|jgi:[FeFe] hydrogenase (group B1/B3)|nr:4Fe-4S binding protein [Puniceicoccales bacterium]